MICSLISYCVLIPILCTSWFLGAWFGMNILGPFIWRCPEDYPWNINKEDKIK